MLDVTYNGDSCKEHGIFLYDIPTITLPERSYNSTVVSGKRGAIIVDTGAIDNIIISCTFSILHRQFIPNLRRIKQWLRGNGRLFLSETPDTYYEVQVVNHKEVERELLRYGKFTVDFVCYPYEFDVTGDKETSIVNGKIFNDFDECYPEYIIKGEGLCTLFVNDNTMKANIGQELTIDTRRMISFRLRGELMNTSVEGDYTKLYLSKGFNSLSITEGFELVVIPHWGWQA